MKDLTERRQSLTNALSYTAQPFVYAARFWAVVGVAIYLTLSVSGRLTAQTIGTTPEASDAQPSSEGDASVSEESGDSTSDDRTSAENAIQFDIEDELITEAEEIELGRARKTEKVRGDKYSKILRNGQMGTNEEQLIKKMVKLRVYRLSMEKYRGELHKRKKELTDDVRFAASLQDKQILAEEFRKFYLQEVTDRLAELLDGNFFVRLIAAVTLAELNLTDANRLEGIREAAFIPAAVPLLKIINDPEQHPALKITATRGLGRIALTANVDPRLKIEIAATLIKELKKEKIHRWYRMRLIEAIGHIDQLLDVQNREPFIVKMLTETLVDTQQDWLVRCEAAKALGRANLGNQIRIDVVCFAIIHLAREIGDPYNKNPNLPDWPECYWKLYLAFQPFKPGEPRQAGLLTKADRGTFGAKGPFVRSAYKEILPLLIHVLSATPRPRFTNQQLSRLDEWLKTNKPNDQSVLPGLAPLAFPPLPTPRPVLHRPLSAARSSSG